ncbi:MAG: hypothetical protein J6M39_09485 [Lachnospiraceae bacterium]|nr:hypothetical protein [Lachnospiraceae bacterium]
MKKKFKIIISIFIITTLMMYNCFGAVVSDNDGSAFVTKSEFEALKNDFANQIEIYNTSIDSKIDGAIATYLAGVKLQNKKAGKNYVKNMKDVRFYNVTNTLSSSSFDDIKRYHMVRAFGNFSPPSRDWLRNSGGTIGSWLYNSDGNHNRDGQFNQSGDSTNYFYQVDYKTYEGITYPTLNDNCSTSIQNTLGAYASNWAGGGSQGTKTLDFKKYDLDLTSYTTHSLGSWSFPWSQAGLSMTANGVKFNTWSKSKNGDSVNNYYYFNNNIVTQDTNIYIFDESQFKNYGDTVYTFTYQYNSAHDFWMNEHTGPQTWSYADAQWQQQRAYVWLMNTNPQYGGYYSASTVSYDYAKAKITYKMPDLKQVKSGTLINREASDALGKPVYPYNGVPITTIEKGTVGLKAKIQVTAKKVSDNLTQSNKPYYILISNNPFANSATSSLITAGENQNIKIFHVTNGANDYEVELESDVLEDWGKEDDIYMRVMIEDANCYASVNVEDVELTVE